MTEHESRKCNEGRGVWSPLVNIKVVFVENGIFFFKKAIAYQAKRYPMAWFSRKQMHASET